MNDKTIGVTLLVQLGYTSFIFYLMAAESRAGRLDGNSGIYLFSLAAGLAAIWWFFNRKN